MTIEPIPVVVLQYGKFELTTSCLKSLREQKVSTQIILVDGNSPGKSNEILQKLAEQADQAMFLDKNLGYAGANNKAIAAVLEGAESEYVFVVNNDTIVDPVCLPKLLEAMARHPKAAQIVPQVLYPNGTLQAAGGQLKRPEFEPRLIGHLGRPDDHGHEQPVDYAPGMAMLVRTKAIREVGLIPEEYFMYGEDVDWSLGFHKAGWEIWFCPEAQITHYDSASIGSFSWKKGYYLTRANVMLARKWANGDDWPVFQRLLRRKLIRQTVKHLLRPGFVRGMWSGYRAGLQR